MCAESTEKLEELATTTRQREDEKKTRLSRVRVSGVCPRARAQALSTSILSGEKKDGFSIITKSKGNSLPVSLTYTNLRPKVHYRSALFSLKSAQKCTMYFGRHAARKNAKQ